MGESKAEKKARKLRDEQYMIEAIVQSRLACMGWNNQVEIDRLVNERLRYIGVLEREKEYGIGFNLEVNRLVEQRLRDLEDERKEKEREEKEKKKKLEKEKAERVKVDTTYDQELSKISVQRFFLYLFVLFASFALNPRNEDYRSA